MKKFILLATLAFASITAHAGEETTALCYNEYWDAHAQVTIKRKVAHSIFTGDYYVLKATAVVSKPSLFGAKGVTADRPWKGKYYFRTNDKNHMRLIMDESVYTNGRGTVTLIKGGGRQSPQRSIKYVCG